MNELIDKGKILFGEDETQIIQIKEYLKDYEEKLSSVIHLDSRAGSNELTALFGEDKIFTNPKPAVLLREIFSYCLDSNDVILDFFGGSGSTGQAVMELNEGDNGNRKFILVQLPQLTDEKSEAYKAGYKKISDITIERNKRVVERIITAKKGAHPNLFENPDDTDALKGLGFKVFNLEKSYFPRTDWSPDANLSEAENVRTLK